MSEVKKSSNTCLNLLVGNKVEKSLDAVTVATEGTIIDVSNFTKRAVWTKVPVNTGAVTMLIKASPTGEFSGEEVTIQTKTYTAETGNDVFHFQNHYPFIKVDTETHTNATFTATVVGGN